MHMADMLVSPAVGTTMYAASLGAAAIACHKIKFHGLLLTGLVYQVKYAAAKPK